MYDVPDNSFYSGILPCHDKKELHTYRVYVRIAFSRLTVDWQG